MASSSSSSSSSLSSFLYPLLVSSVFVLLFTTIDAATSKPGGYLLPVHKTHETNQFYTLLGIGTPVYSRMVIDIGAPLTWLNCESGYNSSSYRPIKCGSTKCDAANPIGCISCNGPPRPGCHNNTCGLYAYNPLTGSNHAAGLGMDTMYIETTTNGSRPEPPRPTPVRRVPFTCGYNDSLVGLTVIANGIMSLSRSRLSLPTQLSSAYKIPRKVAICLPPDSDDDGRVIIGGGPYYLPPFNGDLSNEFTRTPLLVNPVSTAPIYSEGDPSDEYFIGVLLILIDGKSVYSFTDSSLLSINETGFGGTKISTMAPYTELHSDIYNAVTSAFIKSAEARNLTRVKSVAPFGACFHARENINYTSTGPDVPTINLFLQIRTIWNIYGDNSMVRLEGDVMCLGFVDAGVRPRTSIVIGSHQLQNNLVEFDMESSMFGVTSLLRHGTSCSL